MNNIFDTLKNREINNILATKKLFKTKNIYKLTNRRILLEWLIDVIEEYDIYLDCLFLSIQILDNYMSVKKIKIDNYQAYGCMSLYIASKLKKDDHNNLTDYVYISDNTYNITQLINIEKDICDTLGFNFNLPNNYYMTYLYMKINTVSISEDKNNMIYYFLYCWELSSNCMTYRPSVVAIAVSILIQSIIEKKDYNSIIFRYPLYYYHPSDISYIINKLMHSAKIAKITDTIKNKVDLEIISHYCNKYNTDIIYKNKKIFIPKPDNIYVKNVIYTDNDISKELIIDGNYTRIYKVKINESVYALKQFNTHKTYKGMDRSLIIELSTMNSVDNNYIINYNNIIYNNDHYYIAMEFMKCDLSNLINNDRLDIDIIYKYTKQILNAIDYLHSNSIIHADIKLNNILYDYDNNIKLADYNISIIQHQININIIEVVTLPYKAPELLLNDKRGYTESIDIWAAAIVIICLIEGRMIFTYNSLIDQIFNIIELIGSKRMISVYPNKLINPNYPGIPIDEFVSTNDIKIIRMLTCMLHPDKRLRITAKDALKILDIGYAL